MKKLILSIAVLFALLQMGQAQRFSPHFDLNLGLGVLPTFLKDYGKANMLPVSFSADYRLSKQFSLGLQAGYSSTASGLQQFKDGSTGQWNHHLRVISLRSAAHSRTFNDCWGIYGGVVLGYASSKIHMMEGEMAKAKKEKGIDRRRGSLLYTGFLGARCSISPHVGFFGEISYGVSIASIGLSVRI